MREMKDFYEGTRDNDISPRILWIEGLRGISCLAIFFHHYFLKYYPESYYGKTVDGYSYFFAAFSYKPIGVLLNGNFYVFIFLLISGYVVSKNINEKGPNKLGKTLVKRYFSLMIPLFICESFYYFCYRLNIGGELWEPGNGVGSYFEVIDNSLFKVLFFGDTKFAGAFWMMNIVFVGGVFLAGVGTIGWNNMRFAMYTSFLLSVSLLFHESFYYSILFAGAFLYYYSKIIIRRNISPIAWWMIMIIGFFVGGYPTKVIPYESIYKYMILQTDSAPYIWHWFASIIVFCSLSNIRRAQKLLENKLLLWIGSISYVFYVFHNFCRKIMNPIYESCLIMTGNKEVSMIINILSILIFLFMICIAYKYVLDKHVKRLINYVSNNI